MRPSALLRLALAGTRTDTLRVALTALSAVLAALFVFAAATVLSIDDDAPQYGSNLLNEAGLRPGVATALLLLTLPVLALAGQCGRLGAPARDRRLAAIRLAGATPRQAVALVAAETGAAVSVGVVAGLAVFLVGRSALDGRGLPTDVLPPLWVMALLVVGLPLLAAAVAAVLLRRVAVTPFGVVRRVRTGAPRPWPALLILPALFSFAVYEPLADLDVPGWLLPFVGGAIGIIGVVAGAGWLAYVAGRVLHRYARGPAALLAARRLIADPWAGSRTFAALLACVIFGAGAAQFRAWLEALIDSSYDESDRDFYFGSMNLVDAAVTVGVAIAAAGLLVALAEGIVARRRTYAALVATGVPRATLARSILWQVFAPLVPAILLALLVGLSLVRGLSGVRRHALDRHPVRGPGGRRRHRARRRAADGRGRPAVPAFEHVVGGTAARGSVPFYVSPKHPAVPRRPCRQPPAPAGAAAGARGLRQRQDHRRRAPRHRGRRDPRRREAPGGCRPAIGHRRRVPPRVVAHGLHLPVGRDLEVTRAT